MSFDETSICGDERDETMLCLQRELIKLNQEKKRKSSGLLQANPDRPSSARRAQREESAVLIGSGETNNTPSSDNQFGEFSASLTLSNVILFSSFAQF